MRLLAALALLFGLSLGVARCSCEPEPEPPPIGEGDPIGPPDAGDVYAVDAGPVVCDDDASEDNDERGDAVAIDDADPIVSATVCGDDDDWFEIAAAPGCTVIAELRQDAGRTGDADLLLFSPAGQLVGTSSTLGLDESIAVPAEEEGAYAARVRAGSRDIVPYTLTLTTVCAAALACPGDDRLEDNDTAAQAASLAEGVSHDGIACGDDDDWYFVPVSLGCLADARVATDDDGDVEIELVRGDGDTRIALVHNDGGDARLLQAVTEGGMRYRVSGAAGQRYQLVVDAVCASAIGCPSDDPFEPNDDRASARPLFAPLDEALGAVCNDDDFYRVVPGASCSLVATLTAGDADALTLELVRASDGSVLATATGSATTKSASFTAPNGDAVVLRVAQAAASAGGSANTYRLHVETTCP